jgi:hypothetical protein
MGEIGSAVPGLCLRPSLRLNIDVETPDGRHTRWGEDDPNPANAPMSLDFSTAMPGGFERLSCTLERSSKRRYADTAELLGNVTVRGSGGTIAWEGRTEKTPDTGGFEQQETIEAVGWQAHLEDDTSARELFVDQELSRWQAAGTQRKLDFANANIPISDPSTGTGGGAVGVPSIILGLTPPFVNHAPVVEAEYNPAGLAIGLIKWFWKQREANRIGDKEAIAFAWEVFLGTDENIASFDTSGNLSAPTATGSGTLSATTIRRWAALQMFFAGGLPDGTEGVNYELFFPTVAVYGIHGLTLNGALGEGKAPGLLASDVIAYCLNKWAPKIIWTLGPEGSIQQSSFVIDQLAFLEPTTVAEMIKQAARFELPDWAIWEGKQFFLNERGARGRSWRARVGPAQLQQAGPQIARLWNGVVVTYTDVAGVTRTVGPVGSACESQSAMLEDSDPENPLNLDGLNKYAPLRMGTSTLAGATKVGERFLEESKGLETSGQATIVGHVEDEAGGIWPAWMVRAGDMMSFVDAANPAPRRVVHTDYSHSSRANQIQLDQPPDGMTAILERLSVAIAPIGFS